MNRGLLFAGIIPLAAGWAGTSFAGCWDLRCPLERYGCFVIPSGSMKPNIEPGQCVVTDSSLDARQAAEPGDIVAFSLDGNLWIGRLIAEEGSEVLIRDGRLFIDSIAISTHQKAPYRQTMKREGPNGVFPLCPERVDLGEVCEIARFKETLPNNASYDVLDIRSGVVLDYFPRRDELGRQPSAGVIVPEGRFFALGDNRDNAVDSRLTVENRGWGFVPHSSIEGVVIEIK